MNSSSKKGAIATGHPQTTAAARIILEEGGNAFDAALGAMVAACVCEPVLSSMGGGGFLLAHPAGGRAGVYDFFAHTPIKRITESGRDFYPVTCDFGTAQQEFHIGMASIATPGAVKGLFEVNNDLGKMPIRRIIEPAIGLAKEGTVVNSFQANILQVVGPIFKSTSDSVAIYGKPDDPGRLVGEGDTFYNLAFADAIETMAIEGEDLFYRGEIAEKIAADSVAGGGNLTRHDMEAFEVIRRHPLVRDYKGVKLLTNPPPSSGGILIAFALALLENSDLSRTEIGSFDHLSLLARVMEMTNHARIEHGLHELDEYEVENALLDPSLLDIYRNQILEVPKTARGTTHISVVDGAGNAASLTTSNGEGAGYIVPGTGIMLNNMLGEEDVNPHGFHSWPLNHRMSSMMAPTIGIDADGDIFVLGSGGSNRIRTAILQVLLNLFDFSMPLGRAIGSPRIHAERDKLDIEHGFERDICEAVSSSFQDARVWDEKNLFFGGVHGVYANLNTGTFDAEGDIRRGGSRQIL
jgi:gamma-glutamyltranspeptidase/glutathione hydrolase